MKAPPLARSSSNNSTTSAEHQLKPPFAMPGNNKPPSQAPGTPVPRMKATVTVPSSPNPQAPPRASTPSLHPSITTRSPHLSSRKSRAETMVPISSSPSPSRPLGGPSSGNRSVSSTSRVASKKSASGGHDTPRSRPGTGMGGERASTPMFFHASEVKGSPQPKFFFADQSSLEDNKSPGSRLKPAPPSPRIGTRAPVVPVPASKITVTPPQTRPGSVVGPPTPRANPSKSTPLTPSTAPDHRSHVKFVYANGTEEFLEPRRPGGESESSEGSHLLPSSPHSSNQSSGISTSKMGPLTPVSSPGTIASIPQLFAQRPMVPETARRGSFESARARHGRAMSLGSTPDFKLHADLSKLASPSEEAEMQVVAAEVNGPISPPLSGAQQKIKEMEARAAEARRERKVMDLEISNASLMAINRTLERQMRKQASQLRRFKRLVRSGRFTPHAGLERSSSFSSDRPVSPAALSDVESSVSSHAIADESEDEDGGDAVRSSSLDVSEDEGDDTETETLGDSESESEDDEDDEDGGDVEKHRASDERRLNADLAKHKALLEASVKMNASLRRCQLVTDQLITDAKKALEYKVQASEVWIGGRVIYEDEEEEEDVEVEYPDGGYNVAHTQFEGNAFKGGPVVAPKPAGHPPIVSTGYRMAIPDPSDDVGSEGGDTDFDDAASAFGDRYDGDKYDTETESEWDGQSDAGSEVNMGLGLKLEDVESSVGSGPRYKLV